ncbi:MAG: arsenate reductase ArsC [Candidatus Bathyarchaeota archaeon]|nr:arsenate reductase ArsC [Candidatus Bathyarchaeota archaeon]
MKTVLFVCVHNAARSQMAEAFFNEMAGGRHIGISAGSQPAEGVNPVSVEAMGELGMDVSGARPKRLTADMIERADLVVTMGCGENVCPIVPKEVIEWDLEDPSGRPIEEVRETRDRIKELVSELIQTIG